MENDFDVPSWDEIYSLLLELAHKIKIQCLEIDYIVAVARGGWLPARVLSDLLGNSNLATVSAESQTDILGGRGKPFLIQSISADVKGKCLLLVDDIADTGKSLKLVLDHLNYKGANLIHTATLYYKPWSILRPEYFEKETTKWIVFPWEVRETLKMLLVKYYGETLFFKKEIEKLVNGGMSRSLIDKMMIEFDDSKC